MHFGDHMTKVNPIYGNAHKFPILCMNFELQHFIIQTLARGETIKFTVDEM